VKYAAAVRRADRIRRLTGALVAPLQAPSCGEFAAREAHRLAGALKVP